MDDEIPLDRLELLRLRARVAVLERASMAALELALRIRPEELAKTIEIARKEMAQGYLDDDFAADLHGPKEREFVASEVSRIMRSIQAQLGLEGGVSAPDVG